jgi:hypothetical protein
MTSTAAPKRPEPGPIRHRAPPDVLHLIDRRSLRSAAALRPPWRVPKPGKGAASAEYKRGRSCVLGRSLIYLRAGAGPMSEEAAATPTSRRPNPEE